MKLNNKNNDPLIETALDTAKWQRLLEYDEFSYLDLSSLFNLNTECVNKIIQEALNSNSLLTTIPTYYISDVPKFFNIISQYLFKK